MNTLRSISGSDQSLFRQGIGWTRSHLYAVAATALLVGLAVPFLRKADSQFDNVYLRAANHLLAGEDLYRLEDGYLYPPFMAWLSIPFALPAQGLARLAYYVINVVSLVLLWRWAWRLAGGGRLQGRPTVARAEHIICFLGLACALRFAVDCLQNQQPDLVIAALLLGGCVLWVRQAGAGLLPATLWGLAAGMKCTPLLFVPYLAWRGRWRAALWLSAVAFGVNLLPNLVSGPEQGGSWLAVWVERYLVHVGRSDVHAGVWGSAALMNQSLAGAAYRFFVTDWAWTSQGFEVVARSDVLTPTSLKLIVYGFQAVLLAASAWVIGKPGPRTQTDAARMLAFECSVVLLMMVLISPMSSKPHFATLVLPAFQLARAAVVNRRPWAGICLGLAIACGLLATKDLAGSNLASLVMWHGGVSASAFLLLVGCGGCLMWMKPAPASGFPDTDTRPLDRRVAA